MNFGLLEILLVLLLLILLFGARRIPLLARSLGEGIRNFRAAVKDRPREAGRELPGKSTQRGAENGEG